MNWRDLFLHNLRWKLFSLFIAIVVWNTHHLGEGRIGLREEIFENSATLNQIGQVIEVLTPQQSPYQFSASPATVAVKLSGGREFIDALTSNDILVYVDAGDYPDDGTNSVPVRVQVLGGRARLLEVKPTKVTLIRTEIPVAAGP